MLRLAALSFWKLWRTLWVKLKWVKKPFPYFLISRTWIEIYCKLHARWHQGDNGVKPKQFSLSRCKASSNRATISLLSIHNLGLLFLSHLFLYTKLYSQRRWARINGSYVDGCRLWWHLSHCCQSEHRVTGLFLPSKILFITELGIQEAKLYFGFWSCELREFRIQSSSAHRPSALLSQTSSQTQLRSLVLGTTFHWVWSNPVHTKGTMAPQMSLDNQLVNKNYLQSR